MLESLPGPVALFVTVIRGSGWRELLAQRCQNQVLWATAKAWISCALAAMVVGFSTLGGIPSLHKALHHEARASDSTCAICLFAHSQIDSADTTPALNLPSAAGTEWGSSPARLLLPRAPDLLPPGRAPPAGCGEA